MAVVLRTEGELMRTPTEVTGLQAMPFATPVRPGCLPRHNRAKTEPKWSLTLATRRHKCPLINPAQKQFSLNREASKKQFPISSVYGSEELPSG
jgi:hypothetical protein